jgi:hypothetical protein
LAIDWGTVVEQTSQNPKFRGSNPGSGGRK